MKETKILYPFSGVMGIFFPNGKLCNGGTCEFASKICLKECGALKNAIGDKTIGYAAKNKTFQFIIKQPVFASCGKITKEMEKAKSKILHWFAAGDCMGKYTDKIVEIIKHLSTDGLIQCGFTRNENLWKKVCKVENVHLVFTIESKKRAKLFMGEGMIIVPDYIETTAELYKKGISCGTCDGIYYELSKRIKIAADCNLCYEKKCGCFS